MSDDLLLIYCNPDDKDKKCKEILIYVQNFYAKNKRKLEVLNIDELELIPNILNSYSPKHQTLPNLINKSSTNKLTVDYNNNSHISHSQNSKNSDQKQTQSQSQSLFTLNEEDKLKSLELVKNSNIVLFIFPIIWGSCPSKLKLWMEIIYNDNLGISYDKNKIYTNGLMKGKISSVLCSVDNEEIEYGYKGRFILSLEETLEHFTHGVLGLYGYSVKPTFAVYNKKDDERQKLIGDDYEILEKHITCLEETELLYNFIQA